VTWIREHSLSLIVTSIWLTLMVSSFIMFEEGALDWLSERAGGHSDDAFGALVVVLGHKWFIERGERDND
jgi:hypothetical protein